jgi:SAM-dependent methyltransferase/uncharacterized protein YbaR (Trm112 family)
MNERLLAWLRCPRCGADRLRPVPFTVTEAHPSASASRTEIVDGILTCACGQWFPVIGGVPRLLLRPLRDALNVDYPGFFQRHADRLPGPSKGEPGPIRPSHLEGQIRTMESFGFEWNTFEDYANDNFDAWVAPLGPEFFRGKIGLDAGCGGGRHAMKARSYGAEVVAMDLSPAVDAAYRKARAADGVHVIQGDIFNPPLAPAAFDFVYSLGVLHHTPDPPRAFRSLVPLLRPGGTIAVMVYARGRRMILGALALVRVVSTRLPLSVTQSVAWSLAALDTCGPIFGYRALRRLGVPPALLDRLAPEHVRLYAGQTFRTCYTDWLDRLSYPYVHYYSGDDLARWFTGAGLASRAIRPLGGHGWVGLGEASGSAATATSAAPAALERTA